jgi:glutathione synthase/RimK-type ligase-like ATP-grasp enzyme
MARVLLIEHFKHKRGFYQVVLDWVALNLPASRPVFDLRRLHRDLRPEADHTLLVPWLQDPVQAWSERAYANALALEAICDERGIPVLNRVENLTRSGKASGAMLMRECGLRTPRMALVTDADAFRGDFLGLRFPLFVRGDWGHGTAMPLARDEQAACNIAVEEFKRPVAVELIDLPDPHDGLYRKYRYMLAGDRGVAHHMQASVEWVTRGNGRVTNDRTRQEELDYISRPCPHHDLFNRARHALGLDFVAFDYGIDESGQAVVWEANPFPHIKFSRTTLVYRNEALHKTMAVMVALYLERAGIAVPARLAGYLAGSPEEWKVPPERKSLDQAEPVGVL